MSVDVQGLLEEKLKALSKGQLAAMQGTYQFELDGSEWGTYVLIVDGAGAHLERGPSPEASVTISMTADDFYGMLSGSVDPMQSFMAGNLRLTGAMDQAMKLSSLMGF